MAATRPMPSFKLNISVIYAAQILSYLLPLVTLPYLVRVLGVESYGAYAWLLTAGSMLSALSDFGFGVTGLQQVGERRDDPRFIMSAFADITAVKLVILVLGSAALLLAPAIHPGFAFGEGVVHAVVFAFSASFMPAWFLFGLEKGYLTAIANLAGRGLSVLALFLLVDGPEDMALAIWLNALGFALPNLATTLYIFRLYWRDAAWPTLAGMAAQTRLASDFFYAELLTQLYLNGPMILIGLLLGPAAAGLFGPLHRIYLAGRGALGLLFAVFTPRIVYLRAGDERQALRLAGNLGLALLGVGLAGLATAPLIGETFVFLVYGHENAEALRLFGYFALLPLAVGLGTVWSQTFLLNFGLKRPWLQLYAAAVALFIPFIYVSHLATDMLVAVIIGTALVEAAQAVLGLRLYLKLRASAGIAPAGGS